MQANINIPAHKDKSPEGLLSVKEAAAYLGVSKGWVYGSGIPFAKLGRRRLYRHTDLDCFVEDNLSHGPEKRRA